MDRKALALQVNFHGFEYFLGLRLDTPDQLLVRECASQRGVLRRQLPNAVRLWQRQGGMQARRRRVHAEFWQRPEAQRLQAPLILAHRREDIDGLAYVLIEGRTQITYRSKKTLTTSR
eukprot:CAMPEP_0177442800 /NCGR_PEP_ID=MMETSP0369-20130122/5134_1 /TAXON_ID=447022 ORGANISM="Scrippsiella hangoei-like, Strain SHHI-4" /NCGR_SAMPLE_ID=MMETSP0369 /ASSEMBLY_ACC=CAM_ASM_000364 /LENGTH=117 /DNA_ID=CAMNT_0018914763 /DNA_START=354 /DNA_END=704 /DNA_ORIENTATION=+